MEEVPDCLLDMLFDPEVDDVIPDPGLHHSFLSPRQQAQPQQQEQPLPPVDTAARSGAHTAPVNPPDAAGVLSYPLQSSSGPLLATEGGDYSIPHSYPPTTSHMQQLQTMQPGPVMHTQAPHAPMLDTPGGAPYIDPLADPVTGLSLEDPLQPGLGSVAHSASPPAAHAAAALYPWAPMHEPDASAQMPAPGTDAESMHEHDAWGMMHENSAREVQESLATIWPEVVHTHAGGRVLDASQPMHHTVLEAPQATVQDQTSGATHGDPVPQEGSRGEWQGAPEDMWADRKERLKSNSAAQRRYRARQKEKTQEQQNALTQLSSKVAELDVVKRNRAQLQARIERLNLAIAVADADLVSLQDSIAKTAAASSDPSAAPAAPGASAATPTAAGAAGASQQPAAAAAAAAGAGAEAASGVLTGASESASDMEVDGGAAHRHTCTAPSATQTGQGAAVTTRSTRRAHAARSTAQPAAPAAAAAEPAAVDTSMEEAVGREGCAASSGLIQEMTKDIRDAKAFIASLPGLQVKLADLKGDQAATALRLSKSLVSSCMRLHSGAIHQDVLSDLKAQHEQHEAQHAQHASGSKSPMSGSVHAGGQFEAGIHSNIQGDGTRAACAPLVATQKFPPVGEAQPRLGAAMQSVGSSSLPLTSPWPTVHGEHAYGAHAGGSATPPSLHSYPVEPSHVDFDMSDNPFDSGEDQQAPQTRRSTPGSSPHALEPPAATFPDLAMSTMHAMQDSSQLEPGIPPEHVAAPEANLRNLDSAPRLSASASLPETVMATGGTMHGSSQELPLQNKPRIQPHHGLEVHTLVNLASGLQLSRAVKMEARKLYSAHSARMHAIEANRSRIKLDAVKALLPENLGGETPVDGPSSTESVATTRAQHTTSAAQRVMRALEESLMHERRAQQELVWLMSTRILDAVQWVAVSVALHPMHCDLEPLLQVIASLPL